MKTKTIKNSGFSLIEVTMALGICASGVLALAALLPIALNDLTESADRNAEARMKQAVAASFAIKDWNLLEADFRDASALPTTFHFDFVGNEVPSGDPTHAFSAAVFVGERRTLAGDSSENRYIRQLKIRVTSTPERADALTNPDFYEVLTMSLGNEAKLKLSYRD